jgi:hypothetical protein
LVSSGDRLEAAKLGLSLAVMTTAAPQAMAWSSLGECETPPPKSEQATAQKIRTMEDQLAESRSEIVDATRELIAVRHELENARDADERFRILEQGLAARQLALVESQRGPKGNSVQSPEGCCIAWIEQAQTQANWNPLRKSDVIRIAEARIFKYHHARRSTGIR